MVGDIFFAQKNANSRCHNIFLSYRYIYQVCTTSPSKSEMETGSLSALVDNAKLGDPLEEQLGRVIKDLRIALVICLIPGTAHQEQLKEGLLILAYSSKV